MEYIYHLIYIYTVCNIVLRMGLCKQVEGLIKLMEGPVTGPIDLGNPSEFTMLELAEAVRDVSPKPLIPQP